MDSIEEYIRVGKVLLGNGYEMRRFISRTPECFVNEVRKVGTQALCAAKIYTLSRLGIPSNHKMSLTESINQIITDYEYIGGHDIFPYRHDFILTDEHLILIIEYLQGETLRELMNRNEDFPEEFIRDFLKQLLIPIHRLHIKGYSIGDICPEHIFIHNGKVRLNYFTIGVIYRKLGLGHLNSHNGRSALYYSPERIKNTKTSNFMPSDVWSLGMITLEMILKRNITKNINYNLFNDEYIMDLLSDYEYKDSLKIFICGCLRRHLVDRITVTDIFCDTYIIPTTGLVQRSVRVSTINNTYMDNPPQIKRSTMQFSSRPNTTRSNISRPNTTSVFIKAKHKNTSNNYNDSGIRRSSLNRQNRKYGNYSYRQINSDIIITKALKEEYPNRSDLLNYILNVNPDYKCIIDSPCVYDNLKMCADSEENIIMDFGEFHTNPKYHHKCVEQLITPTKFYTCLGNCMKINDHIVEINLSSFFTKPAGIIQLSSYFDNFPNLEILNLSSNSLGNHAMKVLSATFKKFPKLSELILENNDIGPVGLKEISSTLHHLSELTILNLRSNKIGSTQIDFFVEKLANMEKLEVVDLSKNLVSSYWFVTLKQNCPKITFKY